MGSNQSGSRNYNERLIVDIVRRFGPLSKAEISRITQLSPQTATIIVNRLIKDGLLKKLSRIRGKVGQPSTPIDLDANGALSIGIKVGRRSTDITLVSLTYEVILKETLRYRFPDPETVVKWLKATYLKIIDGLSPAQSRRLLGLGIASPSKLYGWEEVIDAPEGVMSGWRDVELAKELEALSGFSTETINDASAACLAHLTLEDAHHNSSFLHLYVATFVGGGLVINGQLYTGKTGNAGALGSLSLGLASGDADMPAQLIELASVHQLEKLALANGFQVDDFDNFLNNPRSAEIIETWIATAANGLALAIVNAQSILDMDHVVIDGGISEPVITRLCAATKRTLSKYDFEGIEIPEIVQGQLGSDARALGAAILPFQRHFSLEQGVLNMTKTHHFFEK